MTTKTEMEPIHVSLSKDALGDLIYQRLEDDGDADSIHARHAITFAIEELDKLGLIVRGG